MLRMDFETAAVCLFVYNIMARVSYPDLWPEWLLGRPDRQRFQRLQDLGHDAAGADRMGLGMLSLDRLVERFWPGTWRQQQAG
jgi:hypothetical protein